MFRQTPSGPTFTQTPLLCVPEDEPEPDWAGVVAGAVLAGAGAGAEVAGGLCFDVTWLGLEPPLRVVPPLLLPLLLVLPLPDPLRPEPLAEPLPPIRWPIRHRYPRLRRPRPRRAWYRPGRCSAGSAAGGQIRCPVRPERPAR